MNFTKTILNKQTKFNVIDEYQHLEKNEIDEIVKNTSLPYGVAAINVTGDLNTGNIIRTSSCFAAEKVFIIGRRKWDRRSSVGGHKWIPEVEAHYVDIDPFDWESALQIIRVNNYTPILFEQYGKPLVDYDKTWHYGKPCLIFGSEDEGIPKEICEKELCYSIPQFGVLRSLNVASAAAIAIHHISAIMQINK